MKNAVLYFFLLLSAVSLHGQNDGADCGMYGKKTVEQRNKLFPFNKTTKVLLVSYADYELRAEEDTATKPPGIHMWIYKREGFKQRVYNTLEEVELTNPDINRLSDILVNFTLKDPNADGLLSSVNLCYIPRNSILFLDSDGKIVCNFEICFECARSNLSPDYDNLTQIDDVYGCGGKLDLIRELFQKNGIKYGVEEK